MNPAAQAQSIGPKPGPEKERMMTPPSTVPDVAPPKQIMSVEEFAEFVNMDPVWVRRHLRLIPGVIRHSRKMIRIDVCKYLQEVHR